MLLNFVCCTLIFAVGENRAPSGASAQTPAAECQCPCKTSGKCDGSDSAKCDGSDSSKCGTSGVCNCDAGNVTNCDAAVVPASAVIADRDAKDRQRELLRQKLAQRDRLQREIEQLSEATQSWQQIVVRVQVMELNLTKMRKRGFDFTSCGAPFKPADAAFWTTLQRNNVAKVLAEPTIVTVSGRPASIHVGGELPIPAGADAPNACNFVNFGTKFDVLAHALGDDKVRLEVRPRISEPRSDNAMTFNGHNIPSFRITECDAACELQFGQTAALTGLVEERIVAIKTQEGLREEREDVLLAVLVTAEAPAAEPASPRVARNHDSD